MTDKATWEEKVEKAHEEFISRMEPIAKKCWTRIAANDGWFDEEYMTQCIFDAMLEAIRTENDIEESERDKHADWCASLFDCDCGVDK